MTEVALTAVNVVTTVVPKVTAVTPVKPVPVMVTDVPPAVVPDAGEIAETTGAVTVVLPSAAAGEVITPRITIVRQKSNKKVSVFIRIATQIYRISRSGGLAICGVTSALLPGAIPWSAGRYPESSTELIRCNAELGCRCGKVDPALGRGGQGIFKIAFGYTESL